MTTYYIEAKTYAGRLIIIASGIPSQPVAKSVMKNLWRTPYHDFEYLILRDNAQHRLIQKFS